MGSTDIIPAVKKMLNENNDVEEYSPNLKILPRNDQVKELQTILRDRNTSRSDFKFYADRLIRLVIEESLNQLPFSKCVITTPTGAKYKGLKYQKGNCGVSIVRSGEAMEQGLRDCCRSIRIGKILVESDMDTHEARVVYAKFPDDISDRKVLLMYPIMSTGNTVIKAIAVLKEHNVQEENIILSNLFCTPFAAKTLVTAFPQIDLCLRMGFEPVKHTINFTPMTIEKEKRLAGTNIIEVREWKFDGLSRICSDVIRQTSISVPVYKVNLDMKILTSEIHHIAPNHFGQKYFGTD